MTIISIRGGQMTNLIRTSGLTLALPLLLAACGGDGPTDPEVRGCNDIAALNFNRDANVDDGSCTYEAAKQYTMRAFDEGVDPTQRQVTVLFQVTNQDGDGIAGLGNSDFRIAENGRLIGVEARPNFSPRAIPFSIRTVLVLDLSSSVEGLVPQIKQAAITLVNSKLTDQQFAIYKFDSQATLVQEFTSDAGTLIAAINSLPETGLLNSTNLYGAVRTAAGAWEDQLSTESIVDGSIVLFTDGFHNANSLTVNDALNALRKPDGTRKKLFVAALNTPDLSRTPLQQLTENRAERYVEASNVGELSNVFREIQNEIAGFSNSLYLLTYQSPITDPASREQTLEIAVLGNSNLNSNGRIRTRFNSRGFGQ